MKKTLAWIIAMLLLLGSASAEMVVPEAACSLPMDEWIELDLDNDSEAERVQLHMEGPMGESHLRIIIEGTDGAMNICDTHIQYPSTCFSMDINGDGLHEILLSGDVESDDYITYCLNYDLENGIQTLSFADASRGTNTGEYADWGYGRIVAQEENTITLRGSQDVLGTWMADRTFTLKNGVLELEDSGMWIMQDVADNEFYWEYFCLIPVKEVPVTFEDGNAGSLAAGEKFVISYTDKVSVAGFVTQDGKKGSIAITENTQEGWGHMINGIPDYEYFEYVPYAD